MLRMSICCFVLSIATLYASSGDEMPPVIPMMKSPYADMSYESLNQLSFQTTSMIKDCKKNWRATPVTILGMLSVSRDTASNLLKACDVLTPCALVCLMSNGCTCSACGLACLCGLRRTPCGKKCGSICEPKPFKETQQSRVLRMQLQEIQIAMEGRPNAEKAHFLRGGAYGGLLEAILSHAMR